MSTHTTRDSLPVKSLRTAFRIVETLVSLEGATVSEVAAETDTAKATVHDHLNSMRQLGYVTQSNGSYYVSTYFLRLGERARQGMHLYRIAQPELVNLADQTGEYASLVVEEHGEGVIMATERGKAAVPLDVYNGIRMPMHTTAPCKAILAFLPDERIRQIIDEHDLRGITPHSITDEDALWEEIEQIRSRGYALGHEERVTGVRTIGAPIIDKFDCVRGSISVWGPTNRIGDQRFNEEIPRTIMEAANIIEIQLNYQ